MPFGCPHQGPPYFPFYFLPHQYPELQLPNFTNLRTSQKSEHELSFLNGFFGRTRESQIM